MTEVHASGRAPEDDMILPTPPFASENAPASGPSSSSTPTPREGIPRSRPLSEISDNSDHRRSFLRTTSSKSSRPTSEVREDPISPKTRIVTSPTTIGEIKTITLNLNEYAAGIKSPTSVSSAGSGKGDDAPAPPSPTTKPGNKPNLPPRALGPPLSNTKSIPEDGKAEATDGSGSSDDSKHVSNLLKSKRLSLRPSPLSASYADVTKPQPSPPQSSTSIDSNRSSVDLPLKPIARAKPSWLRRASGNNVTRTKSKSPAPAEDVATLPTSSSLPPALPPRNGKGLDTMGPPEPPRRSSYAHVTAGPSRSRLGDGQGQPAFAHAPPALPSREHVGNIRNRLAAWTQAAQSSSGFSRSESSSSIATISAPSAFSNSAQRIPASAQRVFGHAGTAVQKGWAGLRSRGVTGSISSMSGLSSSGRRGSLEPSGSWASGLGRRGSRDRTQSVDIDGRPAGDGPVFEEGVIRRPAGTRTGRVFGRELVEVGRAWGISRDIEADLGDSEYQKRRRACLPALVVRAVEYLEIWGPKEEGIFRISGRTSHLSKLRKEFDAGADLDLRQCHPADLDPHAVSGIFKTYLRELPSPLLTNALAPQFDAYVRKKTEDVKPVTDEDLQSLLVQLPTAHWFLLADVVHLLELIPSHSEANRMTLNALMLSLGPSLNISGGILTELLERRQELFATPPPIEGETALIDFGDVDIEPPSIPLKSDGASRSTTPLSHHSEDAFSFAGKERMPKKKPSLPKKPSITRLLSAAGGGKSASRQASMETLQSRMSIVDVDPPRVDVPIGATSPLPTFEAKVSSDLVILNEEEINEAVADPAERQSLDSDNRPSTESVKPPTTPTPIADKFTSAATTFPSLRSPHSSLGSISSASLPTLADASNPVSIGRRGGAPVFFSSASSGGERHSRSPSAARSISTASLKRKDDQPDGEHTGSDDDTRAKRLSAGPGVLGREVGLECA